MERTFEKAKQVDWLEEVKRLIHFHSVITGETMDHGAHSV